MCKCVTVLNLDRPLQKLDCTNPQLLGSINHHANVAHRIIMDALTGGGVEDVKVLHRYQWRQRRRRSRRGGWICF
jgi:hypothetical protein